MFALCMCHHDGFATSVVVERMALSQGMDEGQRREHLRLVQASGQKKTERGPNPFLSFRCLISQTPLIIS